MGYAQTISGSYVSISSDTAGVTGTTVNTARLIGAVSIPALKGNIRYASLDCVISDLQNTNAAANWLVSLGSLELFYGGAWHPAINATFQGLHVSGSSYNVPNLRLYGDIDIKQYCSSNGGFQLRFEGVEAHLNNMEFYCVCILNIYFE